jgi:hypothetical protein
MEQGERKLQGVDLAEAAWQREEKRLRKQN